MKILALALLLPAVTFSAPADEDAMFSAEPAPQSDAFASGEVSDNALQLGGSYYHQALSSVRRGMSAQDLPLNMPLQFDAFLDARPSDRLRGFVRARMLYDSALDAYGRPTRGGLAALPSSVTFTAAAALPNNPRVVLDQAWLKWDVNRTVFLTAGRQQLKWGSARIWNPTDFLSSSRRDPLQPCDLRLGSSMLKAELPWEAAGGALYALALLDNPQPASTVGQVGGAFRAEFVLLGAEMGLDAVTRDSKAPSYGADLSMGLGPIDVYAEAAYLQGGFQTPYLTGAVASGADLATLVAYRDYATALQASCGMDFSFAWKENRQATLGMEYFYNEIGVEDAKLYPALLYFGRFQPFYLSKHYAAVYLRAEGPDAMKRTSYSLSNLANLTDGSVVSRLDFSWLLLSHLSFGAHAAAHYGNEGGEFFFAIDTPSFTNGATVIPPAYLPATIVDLGLSIRLGF